MLLDICRQQSQDHDVHIVVVNAQYDAGLVRSSAGQYTVHRIERPVGSRNPWYLAKFCLRLATLRPDILHLHQLSLINALRFVRAPTVATVHDTKFDMPRNPARFQRVICISTAVEQVVRDWLPNVATVVIHNGVRAADVHTRDRILGRMFRIVQVSRLVHEKKGQDVLLRALQKLREGHADLQFQVDFLGGGPSLDYLRAMAASLGLTNRVRFLGEVSRSDVYRNLRNYDLLVQPSRYEGFGLTVVEAMMAGVPVLVSNIEGPLEIIHNGRYGDYFDSGDEIDLAAKLAAVALRAPAETTSRCAAARMYALENFEIGMTAKRYNALYEACVSAAT